MIPNLLINIYKYSSELFSVCCAVAYTIKHKNVLVQVFADVFESTQLHVDLTSLSNEKQTLCCVYSSGMPFGLLKSFVFVR